MADPRKLRMAQLFYGWPKYFEADPRTMTQVTYGW
jgi:hypothetical protein